MGIPKKQNHLWSTHMVEYKYVPGIVYQVHVLHILLRRIRTDAAQLDCTHQLVLRMPLARNDGVHSSSVY